MLYQYYNNRNITYSNAVRLKIMYDIRYLFRRNPLKKINNE